MVQVVDRVCVEPASVTLDRAAHRSRMRSEQEGAELDEISPEAKLRADGVPRRRCARLDLRFRGERLRAEQTGGCEGEAGAGEEVAAVERHDPARS